MINNNVDKQYFELVETILKNGSTKKDRTGTGTISIFDYTMRFPMKEGFPLLTSKKMFTKGIIHELIWFLRGDTNIKYLVDNDVHIWDGDAYKEYLKTCQSEIETEQSQDDSKHWLNQELSNNRPYPKDVFIQLIKTNSEFAERWGDLGPIYGKQWREWSRFRRIGEVDEVWSDYRKEDPIDQIQNLINDLKTNPDSRRLMVSAWNVGDLEHMILPPCHYSFQVWTREMSHKERISEWCESLNKHISYGENVSTEHLDSIGFPTRKLSLKWMQRSVDVGLGLGFNIASYALLLGLLAKEVNMIPEDLIFSGGDCHIYLNHIEQIKKQLKNPTYPLPKLNLKNKSLESLEFGDIEIVGYQSAPVVKMELSN